MKLRTEHGKFAMNIGATNILDQVYLDDDDDDSQASDDDDEISMDDPEAGSELMDLAEDDLDYLMASTAEVGKRRGVDLNTLPRFGELAMKMPRTPLTSPPKLPFEKMIQFYPETTHNDRMLRYKRIKDFFFMDTFFATKKGGQSSRGHTCCQLFVTDKGFIYVVSMKR